MSYQPISTQSYASADEAAMGGFLKVKENNGHEKSEYAFWVVLKVNNGKMVYHYTEPQTNNTPHGVEVTVPLPQRGHHLRGFCHTHPDSIQTRDYSWDDFKEFKRLAGLNYSLTFYMMNKYNEIRVARAENEFTAGKTLYWKAVKP